MPAPQRIAIPVAIVEQLRRSNRVARRVLSFCSRTPTAARYRVFHVVASCINGKAEPRAGSLVDARIVPTIGAHFATPP